MIDFNQYKRYVVACDHGGFQLKKEITDFLKSKGLKVFDISPEYYEPIPFVDVAKACCGEVLKDKEALGILFCGTGIGISIAANRIKGIRAAILYDEFSSAYSKKHNDANILVFGGRTMDKDDVIKRMNIFLSNKFEGGKYANRNSKLDEIY